MVADLARKGIQVVVVHEADLAPLSLRGFAFMAAETGGLNLSVDATERIPEAILSRVRQLAQRRPVLSVPERFDRWVTIDIPAQQVADAAWQVALSFHPPEGTPTGRYGFPLLARLGGVSSTRASRTEVELEVAANP